MKTEIIIDMNVKITINAKIVRKFFQDGLSFMASRGWMIINSINGMSKTGVNDGYEVAPNHSKVITK